MRPLIRTARLAASAASPSAAHASADIISRPVGGLVGAEPGGHGGCGGAGDQPLALPTCCAPRTWSTMRLRRGLPIRVHLPGFTFQTATGACSS
jgi:hypothetical protein